MKFLLALLALPLLAQQTQPVSTPQPNLILQFPFTAVGVSPVIDNRQIGALTFTLTVSVPTTVSALSLVVQTAQDNGSANCSTCSWSTATAATGSNPNTLTTGWNATFSTALTTFYPYVRLNLTAMTGTGLIVAKLYSSITSSANGGGGGGGSGCVGTDATPCIVTPTGIAVGPLTDALGNSPEQQQVQNSAGNNFSATFLNYPYIFNGASWDRQYVCTLQGTFSSSSAGNQQLIALSSATTIRLCTINFSTSIPENVSITRGTGTNCGTGTATIQAITAANAFDFEPGPLSAIRGTVGAAICINPAAAQAFTVNYVYAQF